MNPLEDLRATEEELRGVDPLVRARARMEAGEAVEAEADRVRREVLADRQVSRAEMQYVTDRAELARQGHLTREVEAMHRETEIRRAGRIAELRLELDRLTGQDGTGYRPLTVADVESQLARNAAERDAWSAPPVMRQRQAALADEIRRDHAEVFAPRRAAPRQVPLFGRDTLTARLGVERSLAVWDEDGAGWPVRPYPRLPEVPQIMRPVVAEIDL